MEYGGRVAFVGYPYYAARSHTLFILEGECMKAFLAAMSLKLKIIIACVVIAIAGGVTAIVILTSPKTDTYRVLKVFELTGSAVVSRQGTGDIDAYVGMNLESGDKLFVDNGSTLRISMDGDKYVLLDSGTVLELIAEGTASGSRTAINLIEGTILNEITTSLSANSSYEVATPKATMAVRGTSFMVTVERNEDGGYYVKTNTFHGKVEAALLDADGNPTGIHAMVPEDKCVVIRTVPNPTSGNPAEVDGTSFFVFETEPGVYTEVPEGSDPVSDIIYDTIAQTIKECVLRSNDNNTMTLNDYIISKLKGLSEEMSVSISLITEETTTEDEIETETSDSRLNVTDMPESETTFETTPTTVPETTTTVTTTTTTTVPTTTTTAASTSETTKKTKVTTVTTSETITETVGTTVTTEESSTETVTASVPAWEPTESSTESTTTTWEEPDETTDDSAPTRRITVSTTFPSEDTGG